MGSVTEMVETAARNNQPGIALTDHGNMSGTIELYKASKKHNLAPFPGEEFYLVHDKADKDAKRYHMGVLALNLDGYKGLVELSSRSHQRSAFHRKPRIDFDDLDILAQRCGADVLITTGCFFGILIQTLLNHGEQRAIGIAQWFAQRFPHTYIETQMHNTIQPDGSSDDVSITEALWEIANKTGIPVVITNDSHYCHLDQVPLHDAMKRMVIHGLDPDDDAAFPGDAYHLCKQKWIKDHYAETRTTQRVYNAALASFRDIIDLNKMAIPAIDNYRFQVPHVAKNPQRSMENLLWKAAAEWWPDSIPSKYMKRLKHEIEVFEKTGFADYLLFVAKVCRWARKQGILLNIRGSANGSLVCYMLDITNIDPIEWKVGFDRFMTEDRTKPPDIDIDVEDTRRQDIVDYLSDKYTICQIGTYNSMGVDDYDRGSLFVQYISRKRRDMGPEDFKAKYGWVDTISDLPEDEQLIIRSLGGLDISKAPGSHAAGFIIEPPGLPISDYVPTMLIPSSKNTVTQYEMKEVEALGFVKLDLLGLRTLTTMRRCLEMIDRDPLDGLGWIPLKDQETFKALRKVEPNNGIFQFDGKANAWGTKKLKPRTVKDCIDAMALFRPAAMKTGQTDTFIDRRFKRVPPPDYPHPCIEKALKTTQGVVLYQEQVMDILRDLGMGYELMNKFLDAVKASGSQLTMSHGVFREFSGAVKAHCVAAGMSSREADWVWDQMKGFADYGFNEAHATAYGLMGYQAAYLKTHHPLEYMTAVLETTAGTPKEKLYVREARRLGIRILPPDVNISGDVWTIDKKRRGIRKGLSSIDGIGIKAASEIFTNAPFDTIDDLINNTDSRAVSGGKNYAANGEFNGVLLKLQDAGALGSLGL
jgi:DNA polymerase-3 subunit alpha